MAKRKTDDKDERIETLESALAWAMGHVPFLTADDLTAEKPNWHCPHCTGLGRNPNAHSYKCPLRRANRLLKGLNPRKWDTK